MDSSALLSFLKECILLIATFSFFLGYGMFRGTQSLINIILGLYLGLLIAIQFPYFDALLGASDDTRGSSVLMIVVFLIFSGIATFFFSRLMPGGEYDTFYSDFIRKIVYALSATIIVMIYSFNILPVTEFITPGSPVSSLFAPAEYFFWWLLVPLISIYFLRN